MQDPLALSIPLGGIESSLPLLPEGDYTLQVVESKVEPNKAQTGYNWKLVLATTTPVTALDGREVKANFPLFVTNALQPKPESTDPEAFKRSLAETIDALFGTNKDNRPNLDRALVESAVGKLVIGHVYTDNYEGKNSSKVKRLKANTAA